MHLARGRPRVPNYLPRVVDTESFTIIPAQRPEIGHPYAIGTGDKSMMIAFRRCRLYTLL
jgi:hypothetical protein